MSTSFCSVFCSSENEIAMDLGFPAEMAQDVTHLKHLLSIINQLLQAIAAKNDRTSDYSLAMGKRCCSVFCSSENEIAMDLGFLAGMVQDVTYLDHLIPSLTNFFKPSPLKITDVLQMVRKEIERIIEESRGRRKFQIVYAEAGDSLEKSEEHIRQTHLKLLPTCTWASMPADDRTSQVAAFALYSRIEPESSYAIQSLCACIFRLRV